MSRVESGYGESEASIRRVHHEFKNNLQTVCSLIRLFSPILDSEGQRILKRIEGCVQSMGSMYESVDKTGNDLSRVSMSHYLLTVLRKALTTVDCEEVALRAESISPTLFVESRVACQLGLLFNEIVVHVLVGCLEISAIDKALLDVTVQEDTVRIEVDFGDAVFTRPQSRHLSEDRILDALAMQVDAVIVWPWECGKGSVSLVIPNSLLAA
jgi:hypothetical protein